MTAPRHSALPRLTGNQAAASRPDAHVWLSASAGTGKTQVLAARVFRLLLRGVDPGAILCLTFTKAGAAEMAGRISRRLAAWVRMKDAALAADLDALGERPTPELRAHARTLFAKVLDAPGGGIRISTIHGFCQSLLAAFPMEAGLVPGFRPLEAREEAVLAREALADMLVAAEREGRERPIRAIGALSVRLGEGGAEAFLAACAKAPAAMAALPAGDGVQSYLRRALSLPAGDIEAEIERCCGDDVFDVAALRRIVAANRAWGTATGAGHAEIAERWIAAVAAERVGLLADLVTVAFTAKGEPRKVSVKLIDVEPDYAALAAALGSRCAELIALQVRAAYADLLAEALVVGRDYADAYARAKRRLGAVDFDDLIRAAVALLEQPGIGAWVRYKLDQATEHILIDEAQDTNLAQWTIIDALAEEFFAGEGARGRTTRTLFTVGDFKQAIFGFQGTDPLYFRWAERRFAQKAFDAYDEGTGEGTAFNRLSLTHSFRSTRPVLEFVDAAVAAIGEPGLGAIGAVEAHASEVPGPGRVTLWPPVTADDGGDEEDEEGWVGDATRILATKIARQVRDWWRSGAMLESQGRAIRPEDVMILVKRRGELASLLVARLYAEGVPVAGVDRLRLNAPLAVQDLLAAARFALQPDDDLSLAGLLVSPLIGWSQEELMAAAAPQRSGSLWRHLRQTGPRERLALLEMMLARADLTTPYQFFEKLLSGPLDGRRKLIRRLGEEARDPIEELLSAALDFETLAAPSLQLFLDWFDRGDVEIVRDPSAPLDAVRVMTAHGAKGLQAPVVILADATADPGAALRGILKWAPEEGGPGLPIFRPRAGERGGPLDAVLAASDTRELEEHWRLFYVAATRAEEQLVVAGALGPRAKGVPPATSWYAAADRAFAALGVAEGAVRVFEGMTPQRPVAAKTSAAPASTEPEPLPAWTRAPAPVEARPPRPLAPSALGEDDVADPPPSPAMRAAAERGRLIHALFQRLPPVAPEARAGAADRWLAGPGGVVDVAERAAVASTVLGILDDPRFAELFGPEALAEAPVAAVVGDGVVVSGTIDRLLVTDDAVRLVDFKTGRRAPASFDEIPAYHLRQMAAYAAALGVIFPGRRIEAALLYTATAALFALPADLLDRHKPGFADVQQSLAASG
ncbi:MAG TPA: double-strand break repair helicase AddA [Sphingomonas sp.]|nr:double-strand break repair helicase AddA [Sphingomonas sp.]